MIIARSRNDRALSGSPCICLSQAKAVKPSLITGQTAKKVAKDTERDNFMAPEEAQAYGIIDEVYADRGESLISGARGKKG